jgi:hypothetical protein
MGGAIMGAVLRFSCTGCGYRTEELFLGPAPRPHEYDPVLVTCAACRVVKVIDRQDLPAGCTEHGAAYDVLDDDGAIPCPRCGREMQRDPIAIWD